MSRQFMQPGTLTSEIVEVLKIEQGWFTPAGLGWRLGSDEETIRRILYRLESRSLVES